jgi:hypothetical protein
MFIEHVFDYSERAINIHISVESGDVPGYQDVLTVYSTIPYFINKIISVLDVRWMFIG